MDHYTLNTARASRLIGATLIIWGISGLIGGQLYSLLQRIHFESVLDKDNPLAKADTLFIVTPGVVPPLSACLTGLVLILFSKALQKLLR